MEIVYVIIGFVAVGVVGAILESYWREIAQFVGSVVGLYLTYQVYLAVGHGCVAAMTG